MAVALVSTGVTFPDGTTQTTAASAGGTKTIRGSGTLYYQQVGAITSIDWGYALNISIPSGYSKLLVNWQEPNTGWQNASPITLIRVGDSSGIKSGASYTSQGIYTNSNPPQTFYAVNQTEARLGVGGYYGYSDNVSFTITVMPTNIVLISGIIGTFALGSAQYTGTWSGDIRTISLTLWSAGGFGGGNMTLPYDVTAFATT